MIYNGSGYQKNKYGFFTTITMAEKFVTENSGEHNGYFVEMAVVKKGKEKPYVLITKKASYSDTNRETIENNLLILKNFLKN